jgi:diguanylate cyclase (GGDEF)-like protein
MANIPVHEGGSTTDQPRDEWAELMHVPLDERDPNQQTDGEQALDGELGPLREAHRRIADLEAELERREAIIRDKDDEISGLRRDLDWRQRQHHTERRLGHEAEKDARHDALTGLKNLRAFDEDIEKEVGLARKAGANDVALMAIDLDGFKAPNDVLGHAAGDELLRVAAQVIKGQTRAGDDCYRTGGDEFFILFRRYGNPELRQPGQSLRARKVLIEDALKKALREAARAVADDQGIAFEGDMTRIGGTAVYGTLQADDETAKDFRTRVDLQLHPEKLLRKESQP